MSKVSGVCMYVYTYKQGLWAVPTFTGQAVTTSWDCHYGNGTVGESHTMYWQLTVHVGEGYRQNKPYKVLLSCVCLFVW